MSAIIIVGAFIGFDILTGVLKALYKGNFNSTVMREGGYHKIAECIAIIGGFLVNYASEYMQLGFDIPALQVVAVYISMMEFVSIVENLSELNPQLNELFKPYLEKLKK